MMLIGIALLSTYILTMVGLLIGYHRLPIYNSSEMEETSLSSDVIHFSVIIPFRNEAENLPDQLRSLKNLQYPLDGFEVLFVDDESEDNSVKLIHELLESTAFDYQILSNNRHSNSPKKDAIETAIQRSKFDWIIATDADCELPVRWLSSFNDYIIQHQPDMLVGPVAYTVQKNWLSQFQNLDNYSLQAVTMGSFGWNKPILSNGANLAYRKEKFAQVSGFSENNHIASGDDIFLMEKFLDQNPKGVQFLKSIDAMVLTKSEDSWSAIISQRVRWASKTGKSKSKSTKLVGLLVFLVNLFPILTGVYAVFDFTFIWVVLGYLILKIGIDFIMILKHSRFLQKRIRLDYFLSSALVYPFITVMIVCKSFFRSYTWKGRTYVDSSFLPKKNL